jgi:hypothetical protein
MIVAREGAELSKKNIPSLSPEEIWPDLSSPASKVARLVPFGFEGILCRGRRPFAKEQDCLMRTPRSPN